MPRYIDADKFKTQLEKAMKKMHLIGGVKGVDVCAVIKALDMQPTADVVPKSEVDKLRARAFEQGKRDNVYGLTAEELAQKCEKLSVELESLKIANEKMYSANKEQEAEIEKLTINMNAYGLAAIRIAEQKIEVASEIFAEIEKLMGFNNAGLAIITVKAYEELKKKHTEEQV